MAPLTPIAGASPRRHSRPPQLLVVAAAVAVLAANTVAASAVAASALPLLPPDHSLGSLAAALAHPGALGPGLSAPPPSARLRRNLAVPENHKAALPGQICAIFGAYLGSLVMVGSFIMFVRRKRAKMADPKPVSDPAGPVELKKMGPAQATTGPLNSIHIDTDYAPPYINPAQFSKSPREASSAVSGKSSRFGFVSPKLSRRNRSRDDTSVVSPVTAQSFAESQDDEVARLFAIAMLQQQKSVNSFDRVPVASANANQPAGGPPSVAIPEPQSGVTPHSSRSLFPPDSTLRNGTGTAVTATTNFSRAHEQNERLRRIISNNGEHTPDDITPLSGDAHQGYSPATSHSGESNFSRPLRPLAQQSARSLRPSAPASSAGPGLVSPLQELPLRSYQNSIAGSASVTVNYVPSKLNPPKGGRAGGLDAVPMTPRSPYEPQTPFTPIFSPGLNRSQLREMRRRFNENHVVEDDEDMMLD